MKIIFLFFIFGSLTYALACRPSSPSFGDLNNLRSPEYPISTISVIGKPVPKIQPKPITKEEEKIIRAANAKAAFIFIAIPLFRREVIKQVIKKTISGQSRTLRIEIKLYEYKVLVQKSWKSRVKKTMYIYTPSFYCNELRDIKLGIPQLFYLTKDEGNFRIWYAFKNNHPTWKLLLDVLGKPKQSF